MIIAQTVENINYAHPEDIIGVYKEVYADIKWSVLPNITRQLITPGDIGAPHVLKLYADIMNGLYGPIGPYIPPPPPPPQPEPEGDVQEF